MLVVRVHSLGTVESHDEPDMKKGAQISWSGHGFHAQKGVNRSECWSEGCFDTRTLTF